MIKVPKIPYLLKNEAMEIALNQSAPTAKDIINELRSDFSGHFGYSRIGSQNTIHVLAFILPIARIILKQDEIKVEQPSGLPALFSAMARLMWGHADRMKPQLHKVQVSLSEFLSRKYK